MLAAITLRRKEQQRQERLMLSWQTRSLAMVIAAAGSNASEDLMKFASDLTIDTEEYNKFNSEPKSISAKKLPVNASTQDDATEANYEKAADSNSFEMLAMFGQSMEKGKPG